MIKHLAKCTAFLALQTVLFLGLRAIAIRSVPSSEAPVHATHTEAFLQEHLYPYWLVAPDVLDRFANLPADDPILEATALAFEEGPDRYLAAIRDKDRLLQQAPGPRLICVGGSGLAFGLDSKLLAQRYGYHPINLGLHIRIGPEFMLDHAARHVREGDVVLISLEYDGMLADFETAPQRRERLLRIAPDLADYFETEPAAEPTWEDRVSSTKEYADGRALADAAREARSLLGTALDNSFDHSDESWRRFLADFSEHREELLAALARSPVIAKRYYRRSGFNEYGDAVAHRGQPRPSYVPRSQLIPNLPARLNKDQVALVTHNIERLNRFAGRCESGGARVYFSYPPLLNATNADAFAQAYATLVKSHLRIPILHGIEEMILDESLFFDSMNHLTWEGTCARMGPIIHGLDQHLPMKTDRSPTQHIARRRGSMRLAGTGGTRIR